MTRIPRARTGDLHAPAWSLEEPLWAPDLIDCSRPIRLIIDNDFAGDPDDLPQLVHHLLSPSVEIRGILCSHDLVDAPHKTRSADDAVLVAQDVFRRMGLTDEHLLHAGSNHPLESRTRPQSSPGAAMIVREALRDDPRRLFYAAGGGLTDFASAYLAQPQIAERVTVVWIGGLQHPDLTRTSGSFENEYNRDVDLLAAQVVFDAGFEIWQVPRNVYRTCLVSESELRERAARRGGPLGAYIYEEIRLVLEALAPTIGRAEMYPLGDQPLVLLTVLQRDHDGDDFTSSEFEVKPTPRINDQGTYDQRASGRAMRVYTRLDQRIMFEDFFTKLSEFAAWQERS